MANCEVALNAINIYEQHFRVRVYEDELSNVPTAGQSFFYPNLKFANDKLKKDIVGVKIYRVYG